LPFVLVYSSKTPLFIALMIEINRFFVKTKIEKA